jgi:hypothetical protein
MSPKIIGERRSDRLPTGASIWLAARSSLPGINLIATLESSFDIVFALFGIGRSPTPSGTIINELRTDRLQSMTILNKLSGKALTVEDSSTKQGARIEQITRSDSPNQRWSIKSIKYLNSNGYHSNPGVIPNEARRFWRPMLSLPQIGFSIMADHSGLCLNVLNGSTDNTADVQQARFDGWSNQLWTFVPDNQGFNFIVNLRSGQVLEVANKSLNNHVAVQQRPFNGEDNQRWQLIN